MAEIPHREKALGKWVETPKGQRKKRRHCRHSPTNDEDEAEEDEGGKRKRRRRRRLERRVSPLTVHLPRRRGWRLAAGRRVNT